MPVIVGAVISGRRGRCDKARDRPHSSANCRPEGRTVTAGSGSPDGSPTACANETAANETLHRIVWIGASRQTEHESHGNQKSGDPWFHRAILQRLFCDPCQQITVCDAVSVCHFWNLSRRGVSVNVKNWVDNG